MSLRTVFIILLTLLTTVAYGQKYGNVWQFGSHAAIDFNNCEPIVIGGGSNTGIEGCSSISDTSGMLLFYTNSDTVWDRFGNAMPNGKLVTTTLSQVIIVPKPSSQSQYYIITTTAQANGFYGLQYHVVDMTANNGSGDIISKYNDLSDLIITEQICATYHSNGIDIWLMTHEYGTSNFLAFLLTENGISQTPIISNVGPAHAPCNSNMNARGQIKFSPDGARVAFNGNGIGGNPASNILCVLDFDNGSGMVENPLNLPFSQGEYGLSFSPDNSKLYGATWKAFGFSPSEFNYLYQFDLASGNDNAIINSKVIIDSIQSGVFGDIKIGPDGRIYVINGSQYVGIINSPNLLGGNCDYVSEGVYMEGNNIWYGLNNYIEYTQYCSKDVSVSRYESEQRKIDVAPNPFSINTTIKFENAKGEPINVYVFDVFGQMVFSILSSRSDTIYFSRGNLNCGIYYIRLVAGDHTLGIERIVIL